jgi:RNA polymerase sigma-70 factor (ECF subfamily)
MKYFDDMKYEEISEITGTSIGALKASYHLAVKKIEDSLNRQEASF